MRPILIAISPLLALLLALPAQAKESDYQQPVEVDSVRQLAELNDNKVTFTVITSYSIHYTKLYEHIIQRQSSAQDTLNLGWLHR